MIAKPEVRTTKVKTVWQVADSLASLDLQFKIGLPAFAIPAFAIPSFAIPSFASLF
jgi:hypothetical protein